jgi:predicted GIY-YIG superfamily endonuclease
MGFRVYVLQSGKGRYYYGSTSDLARRLDEHARGKTYTTAKSGPWRLVAEVEVGSLNEARSLERKFKRWKSPSRVNRVR